MATARSVGIGAVSAVELDLLGLTAANRLAMLRAISSIWPAADYLLVDALTLQSCAIPQTAIVRGDATCLSIAAASIVAKVVRDRWMSELDRRHSAYGWVRNKGYGTVAHRRGLARHGLTAFHRRSFAPIRSILEGGNR